MAGMPPLLLGAILLVPFLAARLVRVPLERRVVLNAPAGERARRQFRMDFLLFLAIGTAVMAFNALAFGFPWVGSGMKLVLGCTLAGFFAALDMALSREREVILAALQGGGHSSPLSRFYPMTRKFSLVAVTTTFLVAGAIGLVMSGDVGWLAQMGETGRSVDEARSVVLFEVFFVMGVLLVWVVNVIMSYSRNLKLLFQNETNVLESVSGGDLSQLVPIVTKDEFGFIARHTNAMIHGLRHRLELLTALQLAEDVQRDLLPQKPPKLAGFDIAGASVYCDKTGGDYYDYLHLEDGRLGIVVGDVAGHGVSSALLMTTVRAFIRQRAAMGGCPAEIISDVNRQFTRDVEDSGQFMTLFYLQIDSAAGQIHWVRAGHDPALVYDPGKDRFAVLMGEGMPLGLAEDMRFEELQQKLEPGRIIVIGTDGIWETHNGTGEMFGKDRLKDLIRNGADASAKDLVQRVFQGVNEFRQPLSPDDDVTIVVIRVLDGAAEGAHSP